MKQNKIIKMKDSGSLSSEEIKEKFHYWIKQFYGSLTGFGDEITDRQIIDQTKTATWTACMTFVRDNFTSNLIFRPYTHINATIDPAIIDIISDIYIYYCNAYNKPQSVYTICELCCMSETDMYRWQKEISDMTEWDNVTSLRNSVAKKILSARREQIVGRVIDGGSSTIGAVTMFNNEVLSSAGTGTGDDTNRQIDMIPRYLLTDATNNV